jgi:hypothetical protein
MARHLMDETRDQLRVPVLARRYLVQHPRSLPGPTVLMARGVAAFTGRTDTRALPAVVAPRTAPIRAVSA